MRGNAYTGTSELLSVETEDCGATGRCKLAVGNYFLEG